VLPRVRELAEQGFVPGGTKNNFAHVQAAVTFPEDMDQIGRWILCDAVTSGGLLISVAGRDAEPLVDEMRKGGVEAAVIGEVTDAGPGRILVK